VCCGIQEIEALRETNSDFDSALSGLKYELTGLTSANIEELAELIINKPTLPRLIQKKNQDKGRPAATRIDMRINLGQHGEIFFPNKMEATFAA
jgi:hypothetical protein